MNYSQSRTKAMVLRLWPSFLSLNHEKIFVFLCVTFLPLVFSVSSPEGMREPKAKMLCFMVGIYLSIKIIKEVGVAFGLGCLYFAIKSYYTEMSFVYEDFLVFVSCMMASLFPVKANNKQVKFIMDTLVFMGLAFFAYGASQMAGYDPIQSYHTWADHRPVVFFGQHTLYAPIAATCFAAALLQRKWILSSLLLVPAFLIDSSFSYLGFGIVVLVFLIREFKWKAVFAPLLLIVCLFVMKKVMYDSYRELYNSRGRFPVWEQILELANKRVAFGYGVSSFKQIYPVFQHPQSRLASGIKDELLSPPQLAFMRQAEKMAIEHGYFFNPHNEYLNVYFEGGLLGLFLVLCIFFVFYASFAMAPKTTETWFLLTTFSIFAGNSVGNFPMHLIPQALFPICAFVVMTTRRKWTIMEVYECARNIRIIPTRTNSV